MVARLGDAREKTWPRDRLDHRAANGGHQRIATERSALVTILEAANIAMGHQSRQRHAAAQTLGQCHDIRRDAGMLETEQVAGAADPGLNFIKDEQQTLGAGEGAQVAQEWIGGRENAGLALDRLQHHGHRARRHGGLDGGDVVERNFHETRDFWLEQWLPLGLSRG
jgi:hypothetical protein